MERGAISGVDARLAIESALVSARAPGKGPGAAGPC
jgi:hypothetical protein